MEAIYFIAGIVSLIWLVMSFKAMADIKSIRQSLDTIVSSQKAERLGAYATATQGPDAAPQGPAQQAYCPHCAKNFDYYPEQWQTPWVPCSRCGKSVETSLHQERLKPAPAPDPPALSSCRCQLCSKEIEFAPEQEGTTVACPHCGMETQLYRTSR